MNFEAMAIFIPSKKFILSAEGLFPKTMATIEISLGIQTRDDLTIKKRIKDE
jgi:hypothetical protein